MNSFSSKCMAAVGVVVAVAVAACGSEASQSEAAPIQAPSQAAPGASTPVPSGTADPSPMAMSQMGGSVFASDEPGQAPAAQVPGSQGPSAGGAAPSPGGSANSDTESSPAVAEPAMMGGDPKDFPVLQVGGPEPDYLQPVNDGWEVLLVADWTLEAGAEGYYCARLTLEEDVYFDATMPLSPSGTHHTLLSLVSEPTAPDGIAPCSAGSNGDAMIAGSGVGTDPMTFPEGVAVLAPKGSQLLLNLHLFNPTDEVIEGRSGTLVKTVAAEAVEQHAATTLAGPLRLNIPPGRVTQTGGCTISRDITLVFVSPHMHQLGVHLQAVIKRGDGTEMPLYDDDYDFSEQRIYPIEPISLSAGDRVEVECTYDNTTGATVRFGDSSLSEMCFLTLFHYPDLNPSSFFCPR